MCICIRMCVCKDMYLSEPNRTQRGKQRRTECTSIEIEQKRTNKRCGRLACPARWPWLACLFPSQDRMFIRRKKKRKRARAAGKTLGRESSAKCLIVYSRTFSAFPATPSRILHGFATQSLAVRNRAGLELSHARVRMWMMKSTDRQPVWSV